MFTAWIVGGDEMPENRAKILMTVDQQMSKLRSDFKIFLIIKIFIITIIRAIIILEKCGISCFVYVDSLAFASS